MLKITKYGPYNMAVKMFQRKFSALANDISRRYFHSLCKSVQIMNQNPCRFTYFLYQVLPTLLWLMLVSQLTHD